MTTQDPAPPQLQTMLIEVGEDGIGLLTLNRPEAFNAMNPEMIGEMPIAFSWFADQAPLRALIVTGAGQAFSSGGDLNWFLKGAEADDIDLPASVRHGADVLHQAIVDLRRIPYPVIASINGPAVAAGFSLALACDIRIAAESAFFAPGYARIGASPDGGMTYFLPRVVGSGRALEILLEDPDMSAREALAEHIVTDVVEPEVLMESARARAAKLGAMSPHYVKMAKALVGVSVENRLADHLQLERHGIADSMATEDLLGGVKAFFAGAKPEFHGR